MNRSQNRRFVQRLERAQLELGRAYDHAIQLNIRGYSGTPRMREAQHRLHKAESKIQSIRAEMREADEVNLQQSA